MLLILREKEGTPVHYQRRLPILLITGLVLLQPAKVLSIGLDTLNMVFSRQTEINGQKLIEIVVKDTPVFRLPGSQTARAETVVKRLEQAKQAKTQASRVVPGELNGYQVVNYDKQLIITADAESANRNDSDEKELAHCWANNLRQALGEQPIEDRNRQTAASRGDIVRTLYGKATWYGAGFHGKRTASGETFNQFALTAAHNSLPFGTLVLVTNLQNGKSAVVRINDRGPFIAGRILDLSRQAAETLGMIGSGVVDVRIDVFGR